MTIAKLIDDMEKDGDEMTFASVIKAWRLCEEASITDFARKLGVSRGTYGDLETGRKIPSPTRVAHIAEALEIDEEPLILLALRGYLKSHGFDYKICLESA
ncbi:MAG: helix-turn-helix transcriptional regulator [Bdellovibrionaceae bacterium]|nr:helix-turn-helix transcriptional regulator [Bdellovibrionales bacterium]MCB9086680.1 helix-turn-helix transcriptional regulator [Pseudobdellovibrionaceae bacterium]